MHGRLVSSFPVSSNNLIRINREAFTGITGPSLQNQPFRELGHSKADKDLRCFARNFKLVNKVETYS
jgi:hypothetical protein